MSDKVIVNTSDINDLPYVEQEHSGDKYVLLEDIKHWLEDATPVSGEAVAEVRCRNNEVFGYIGSRVIRDMLPLGTKLYTAPQPADKVPVEKYNRAIEAIKTLKSSAEVSKESFYGSVDAGYIIKVCDKELAEAMKGG